MSENRYQLIFVIDPMCSWCWGFHPIIQTIYKDYSKQCHSSLVVSGLRTKGQMPWNKTNQNYLIQNWKAVQQQTGQTFNFSLFDKTSFDYDTYPACKAIVCVRELWGEKVAFEYLEKIQTAFYVKNEDTTSLEVLLNYIEEKETFLVFYESERAERLMHHDFAKARSMGANAFPSTVKIDTQGHMCCMQGYKTLEEILAF